jgi:hypothetical protein
MASSPLPPFYHSSNRNARDLFMVPPDMSLPDAALARIRDGFAELPGVLDLVCDASPALSMCSCACIHIAESMAGTVDNASVRACAESVLTSALMIPPVIAALVGGFVASYKVSSFAHAAAIRQAPRALQRLHTEWHRVSESLWLVRDDARDCSSCGVCFLCRTNATVHDGLRRTAHRLIREHKATCVRLTTILMAPL